MGCYTYMGNCSVFCEAWGDAVKGTITSIGNSFNGAGNTTTCLGFMWYGSNSRLNMTLMSDFWGVTNASYYRQGSSTPGTSYIMNPLNAFNGG